MDRPAVALRNAGQPLTIRPILLDKARVPAIIADPLVLQVEPDEVDTAAHAPFTDAILTRG